MLFESLPFFGKSRQNEWSELDLDKAIHMGIPSEIFVPNCVAVSVSLQHRHDHLQHDASKCELFEIKRSRSARCNNLSMSISTNNTRDDTVNDILSKDSTGSRNDLWKSATDNNGSIKAIDNLCSYSVVQTMSRNDAARKKFLLDDIQSW
eukprot:CAMPEP_0201877570 /NCGR_PEP_ID=MMETSP0902-20130614/8962_1 /ASSEMBLY_ACC=CAM_ASM_000551 /TAXON_ID=420261 /ORGANISM="Thalassiosira antarctica, Strain CCMP982" /LENGTH=149 /DNA_ID=CAMNT_0048405043 /DNA_START=92 /DNA_END=538 /DNA_ORIENTATION=+